MGNQIISSEKREVEEKKLGSARKPYKTIPPAVIPQYRETLFAYQRMINNLIGAIGIIKSPYTHYPYINYDKSWNIHMQFDEQKLTWIDIKTINIERIKEKIEEFITSLDDPWLQEIFREITKKIQYDTIKYFRKQREEEEESGERHGPISHFGKTKNSSSRYIMESIYNTMGPLRMELFDYDPNTKTVELNTEGKWRLLTQLYHEIDEINEHRFKNIEDIFPGADYHNIKTKQMTIDDITEEEITNIAEYLLSAHHTIDDMTSFHNRSNKKNIPNIIIKEPLKKLVQRGIEKFSKNSRIGPITDPHRNKQESSRLKLARWWFAERISIAAPYLYNKYDFEAITAIEKTAIAELEEKLYKEHPNCIKYIGRRPKSFYSAKDKILRKKSTTEYRDGIWMQIFIDFTWLWEQDRKPIIQEIFKTVNTHIHNHHVDNIGTLHIDTIEIDNKNMIDEDSVIAISKELKTNTYPVSIRKKHKKDLETENIQSIQEYILTFMQGWKSWSNGERSDIKEVIKIGNYKIWGIEAQMLEHGKSINQDAGAHEFLQAEKTISFIINTNKTCPWRLYCEKKDVAICRRATDLRTRYKNLQTWTEKKYTKEMYEKERYYTIPIDDNNREFINQTKDNWNPNIIKEEIREDKKVILIDLTQLSELSSHIAKRHAADLIIMQQANNELKNGKIIQYYYDSDEDFRDNKTKNLRKNKDKREPYNEVTYPWIRQIKRDEIGKAYPTSMKFIESESLISIETWQIPQNASILIPQKDNPNKGYIQSISDLAYALKENDIQTWEDPIEEALVKNLRTTEKN